MRRTIATACIALLVACGGGGGGDTGPQPAPDTTICDAAELSTALAAAAPGDTVRLGSCAVTGSFLVPSGVTLAGAGADATVLRSADDRPVVELVPGSQAAVVADLAVESQGRAGVVARGAGQARASQVTVRATRGVAMGFEACDVVLAGVDLAGPVTAENAGSFVAPITSDQVATHGLVLVRVPSASLEAVTAHGFAAFGVLAYEAAVTWSGGGATENLGTGAMFYGGTAGLTGIELSRSLEGVQLVPPYGGVFAGGADVTSSGLSVDEGQGYGLLHDSCTARHVDLAARRNDFAAVWVQNSTGFELSGTGTELAGNGFAGVVVVRSSGVLLRDARISGTRLKTDVFGETGTVQVGDGVQLVAPAAGTVLERLALAGNERIGLLIDLDGGDASQVALRELTVDGSGTQLGIVAQNGTADAGWDAGAARLGATAVNDQAFSGRLDTVGIVGPNSIPVPGDVSRGLDSLLEP